VRALGGKGQHDGTADVRAAAGDDDRFAFQFEIHEHLSE